MQAACIAMRIYHAEAKCDRNLCIVAFVITVDNCVPAEMAVVITVCEKQLFN